jgi:hypothetical protein
MKAQPWKTSRLLTHAAFGRSRLLVTWTRGRWVPWVLNNPDGTQVDGLTALAEEDLMLRNPFHPVPKVVSKST